MHYDAFWYYLNSIYPQKNIPKKVLPFFLCIFYIKTQWNSSQILTFKRHKYHSLNVWNIEYFSTCSVVGVSSIIKTITHLKNGMSRKSMNVGLPVCIRKYWKQTHVPIKNLHLKSRKEKDYWHVYQSSNHWQNIINNSQNQVKSVFLW